VFHKIQEILRPYANVIVYGIFGVLTTAVNYLIYFPCFHILHLSGSVSNCVAWVISVAFAFLTNKPFVFKSHDWSFATLAKELPAFVGCRVGSGVLETLIIFVTVDQLHFSGNWMKIVTGIVVVILNYFGSKLLVFRKK
jgi:putative flippase GtrA